MALPPRDSGTLAIYEQYRPKIAALERAVKEDPDLTYRLERLYAQMQADIDAPREVDVELPTVVDADCNRCGHNYDYDNWCYKCRPRLTMSEYVLSEGQGGA